MQRLSRLFSRSSKSSDTTALHRDDDVASTPSSPRTLKRSSLLDLPTELILAITSLLPYENAVSFSFTCKFTYELIFHIYKPEPKHNGREVRLLRLLERDLPNHLACPIHERFYSWRPRKSRHYQCPLCTSSKRNVFTESIVICNRGCRSSFYGIFEPERRLMLRYALLGPDYGVSLRLLDHVCKRAPSQWANEVTPKVVNGSLMLWRTQHITIRTDTKSREEMRSRINAFNAAICVHSEWYIPPILGDAVNHAICYRSDTALGQNLRDSQSKKVRWSCPLVFKCDSCATDIRLHMDQTDPNSVVVRFDAYQDLGGLQEVPLGRRGVFDRQQRHRHVPTLVQADDKRQRLEEDLEFLYHCRTNHRDEISNLHDNEVSPETTSTIFSVESGRVTRRQLSGISLESKQIVLLDQWECNLTDTSDNCLIYHSDPMVSDTYQIEGQALPFRMLLDSSED